MSSTAANDKAFDPRLIGAVIAIGIVAFIALWALIALGPDLKSGNDGKGHALSRGAPGYAGIVDLLERAGAEVDLRRRPERFSGGDRLLLILTPTHQTQPGELAELLDAQGGAPWQKFRIALHIGDKIVHLARRIRHFGLRMPGGHEGRFAFRA